MTRLPLPSLASLATLATLALALPAQAAIIDDVEVFWNFGTTASPTVTPTLTPTALPSAPFTVSAITPGNQSGSGTSYFNTPTDTAAVSPGSGAPCLGLRVKTEGTTLDEAACHYFSWTLTHLDSLTPLTYTLTQFSMYTRRSSTGAKAWKLIAYDGVSSIEVASGAIGTQDTWHTVGLSPTTYFETNSSIEFRLYGYDANGTSAINWRIDDLKLVFSYGDSGVLVPPVWSENAATDVTANSITVAWDPVAPATSYRLDVSTFPDFTVGDQELAYCLGTDLTDMSDWSQDVPALTGGSVSLSLANGNKLYSPALDLVNIDNARFTFDARSYGSATAAHLIRVHASTNLLDWTDAELVGEFTPSSAQSKDNNATMSLAQWFGKTIYLRVSAPNSGSTTGAGVNNLRVETAHPSFIAPYENYTVNGTSAIVSGLAPETKYYFRVRSANSSETTDNSTVLSASTISVEITEVTVSATDIAHESATLAWNAAANAINYQIELCKTGAVANVEEPRVIITKIFYNGSNKAVELTNIGQNTANLNEYAWKRWRIGTDFDWNYSRNLEDFNTANGASRMLNAGESILLVYIYGTYPTDPVLQNAKALTTSNTSLGWGTNNRLGLFRNDTLVDCALSTDSTIKVRRPGIFEGSLEDDNSQWNVLADYEANAANFDLTPHIVYIPVFTTPQTSTATTFNLAGLKHSTYYLARVRGVNGGATGPWSEYVDFTTDPQPKTTIIVVR